MTTASPRGLYATLALTLALTVALAGLLMRPGADLPPLRATTFELDEPPVPAAPQNPSARP